MADLTRCLCIVSRDRLHGRDFLVAVQASVRAEDHLEIIVDRRRGEPSSEWHGPEDRRRRPHVDIALQKHGIAIVPAAVPGDERKPEPSLRDQPSGQLFEGRLFGREVPAAIPGDERLPEPPLRDQTRGQLFEGSLFGREISQREIPQRETPERETSQREIPLREIPLREFLQDDIPQREIPQRDIPPREIPQRDIPQREIPQNERSGKAERGPHPLGIQSRLSPRVTTPLEGFPDEPYEDRDDDDAERLESILNFKRERSRRLLLPWIIAVLAIAAAAAVILFPLAHSLKQSAAPRAVPEAPPRATDPSAGGEPPSLSSRGDASAASARGNREPSASPRDDREPSAESSAPPAPQAAPGATGSRRARSSVNEPAPRQAASAPSRSEPTAPSRSEPASAPRSEPTAPPRSEPTSRFTSPRFAGVPSVDVSREPGSPTGMYSARILDPAGRPLSDADVLLLARMSDGTVENVRMQFSPDRGTYRGALPPTRSSLVDLRVRVITGDKRIEIPVGP